MNFTLSRGKQLFLCVFALSVIAYELLYSNIHRRVGNNADWPASAPFKSASSVELTLTDERSPKSVERPLNETPKKPPSIETSQGSKGSVPEKTPPLRIGMHFGGRLGNKLFEYAALYGIATVNNMSPIIPPDMSLISTFPKLKAIKGNVSTDWTFMKYTQTRMYNDSVTKIGQRGEDIFIQGNFCSWKYFDNVRESIRQQFTFANIYLKKIHKFLAEASSLAAKHKDPVTYIGVHIRRGDLLSAKLQSHGHIVSNPDYFRRAMRYYNQKYKNTVFVACTNDKAWVEHNVKYYDTPVAYSPFEDAESDMCLLSQCNHTIISVGTYSWWAGWLSGGDVTYDKRYPPPGSGLWKTYRKEDYYPADWVAL